MTANISLITSLYRSERYLAQYVKRVLRVARECSDLTLQLILVANEATSHEREWIVRLQHDALEFLNLQIDPLFVARETLYASWNRGVRAALGECIGFWNVDDLWNSQALREALTATRAGAEVIYFPFFEMTHIKRLGSLIESRITFPSVPEFNRTNFTRGMMVGPFFMFTRRLYDRIGAFDEQFRIVGDFDWCVRAAKVTDFYYAHTIGGAFVHDGTGLSARGNPRHVAENNIVYLRHGALDKLQPVAPALMRQYQVGFGSEPVNLPQETLDKLFLEDGTLKSDYWDEGWMRQKQIEFIKTKIKRVPRKIARVVGRMLGQ